MHFPTVPRPILIRGPRPPCPRPQVCVIANFEGMGGRVDARPPVQEAYALAPERHFTVSFPSPVGLPARLLYSALAAQVSCQCDIQQLVWT